MGELAQEFDFAKIGRAPAHFVPEELAALNAKLLHITPYSAVAARVRHHWNIQRSLLGGDPAQSGEAW